MATKQRLHQVVALVSGKKTRFQDILTKAHRWVADSLSGISRTYTPSDAEGERLPEESKMVQVKVSDEIKRICAEAEDYYDLVATQEGANQQARADIKLQDGTPILNNIPLGVLLFLEKRVEDLRTFAQNLPTLPVDREWKFDRSKNCYTTPVINQNRSKKVKKVLVKYEATDKHPAQTEVYDADETVGQFATVHMSGAIQVADKDAILNRIESLSTAIKLAREEANSIEAPQVKIGSIITSFVFGPLTKQKD